MILRSDEERLFRKRKIIDRNYVDENKEHSFCWEWTGKKLKAGYGIILVKIDGATKERLCHRVSMSVFKGFDLSSSKFVCHKCDNRICFNPDHLFVGTQQENVDDMIAKGRQVTRPAKGESVGSSKLTDELVLEIASMLPSMGNTEIAKKLSGVVTRNTISNIRHGRDWSWLTGIVFDETKKLKSGRPYKF